MKNKVKRTSFVKKLENGDIRDPLEREDVRLEGKFKNSYYSMYWKINRKSKYVSNGSVFFFTNEEEAGNMGVDKLTDLIGERQK